MRVVILLFFTAFIFPGCKAKVSHNQDYDTVSYEEGTFCAQVEYYNPNTGTSSNYTLTIEVENGDLVKMYFPNGGWLDESHFDPPTVDDDGECSFTSDKGYEYNVTITGSGRCNTGFDEEKTHQDNDEEEE